MTPGPVSQALEHEVSRELRRQGIVVWLDKDYAYRVFVDALAARARAGDFPHPVVGFRGSFLELLFQLEPYGSGLERQPLLIHMPGFNEETVRATPVLELYEAGVRFRKGLETLIRDAAVGRVTPAEADAFIARSPTLEDADRWLESAASSTLDDLPRFLEDVGPTLLVEALSGNTSALSARVDTPVKVAVFGEYLHRLTGLDAPWLRTFAPDASAARLDQVLAAAGAWLLCVEYVHDLRRPPYLDSLARLLELGVPLVNLCRQLLGHLRGQFAEAYVRMADEVESFIAAELQQMTADDLGQIDTFREEENRVLAGAVDALARGEWTKARGWHEAREGDRSFWLGRDQARRWAWNLVGEAAAFGTALAQSPRPLEHVRSLEEAVDRYTAEAHLVDRAHRRFEQRRVALLESRLPQSGPLQEVVGALRQRHRAWADVLARDFTAVCKTEGFLPADGLQQRTLFEQVVLPLTATGEKVALFVVDAFRYEMASELAEELMGGGTRVDLKARLAELPTITPVGMNALAPVAQNGRLQVAGTFEGFRTGEFTVSRPESRARAMGLRAVGKAAVLLSLSDVCETTPVALKKNIAPHGLVLVHSTEIDDAGEANVGLPTFDITLRQLKAAWNQLQLAGVKHAVFTADHGFLLQDETTITRKYGKKTDPHRRHVLDAHPREEAGMVPVSLSSLGYEGLDGYLLFREDTANFATGTVGATFVHGGNSPEERIIPVLTVARPRAEGRSAAAYVIEASALPDALKLHRLRLRVVIEEGTLAFVDRSELALSLRPQVAPGTSERSPVTVVVRDATGAGRLSNGRLLVPVGQDWTEVFFAIEGNGERVRLEVHHLEQAETVRAAPLDTWFDVTARLSQTGDLEASVDTVALTWVDAIENRDFRRVFVHIEKHGAIGESEVTQILGSPRAFRRFSIEFDALLAKLPFRVRIEPSEGGKRYVREGNK